MLNRYSRWSLTMMLRAANLTNRWTSGCQWRRDASSDEHLVGTKLGALKCSSVRRKPSGEQWSRREKVEARGKNEILIWESTLEYLDRLWNHVETKVMPSATAQEEIPRVPPPAPPPQPDSHVPEVRGQRMHAQSTQDQSFLV